MKTLVRSFDVTAPYVRAPRRRDAAAALSLRQFGRVHLVLSNAKLAALGIAMPAWQDARVRYLER